MTTPVRNLRPPLAGRVTWLLIGLTLALSLRYLYWRCFHTLNRADDFSLLAGSLLLAAEAFGFVSMLLFFMQVLGRREPAPAPAPLESELPSVDVFVTICTEPAEILQRTLVACAALDYPAEKRVVWVLDDGGRAEVREMAARFGFRYLARSDRRHAKAGNLNNGLRHASGEFILQLDTDHVPVRTFLKETLGYFRDPWLAFVQTPHHFYNPDCYQRNLVQEENLMHEQDLFFHLIQPGRAAANAVIFAGSAAVFRRDALDGIGGFKTACAIEDMHTGMELQAQGWKAVYHPRILSAGLSPEDFAGLLVQRKRWTKGAVQLFFLDNPLLKRGLTVAQRLHYLGSVLYFFQCWMRLVFLLIPLSLLLWRCAPVVASPLELLWYLLPHYACSQAVFYFLTRDYRSPFWSEVYETASVFALSWTVVVTIFTPEVLVFHVTPKGAAPRARFGWKEVLPHAVLLGLLSAGVVKGMLDLARGLVAVDAFFTGSVWAAINVILLAAAIAVARERATRRGAVRLRRDYPVALSADGVELEGRLVDVSGSGVQVALPALAMRTERAALRIFGDGESLVADSEVRSLRRVPGGGVRAGLRLHALSEAQRDQLTRLMFTAPGSWEGLRRPARDPLRALQDIAASALRAGSFS